MFFFSASVVFGACKCVENAFLELLLQGSHRLEKYLNIQDCLEKSLKIKFALKILEKHSNALKSPCILSFTGGFNTVFGDLNQYKIVVPLFGAAYAAPN